MSDTPGFSLRDTMNVFYKKIILLKIALVVIPLGVFAACLALPPVFESRAKIIITAKKETPALLQIPKEMGPSAVMNLNVDETDLNSEMELLQSPDLWARTVKKIGLPALKKSQEGILASLLDGAVKSISELLGNPKTSLSGSENPEVLEVARDLIKKLKVVPAPKSKIIDIAFKYDDPVMAQKILTTLLEEYIPYHLEVYSHFPERRVSSPERVRYTNRNLTRLKMN
jgi:uncharacterized protein involved in exopolysaccharide biosynthesis